MKPYQEEEKIFLLHFGEKSCHSKAFAQEWNKNLLERISAKFQTVSKYLCQEIFA